MTFGRDTPAIIDGAHRERCLRGYLGFQPERLERWLVPDGINGIGQRPKPLEAQQFPQTVEILGNGLGRSVEQQLVPIALMLFTGQRDGASGRMGKEIAVDVKRSEEHTYELQSL